MAMMGRAFACVLGIASLFVIDAADARGGGRFLGGLVARGAGSAVTHGMRKSYTPDTLTVDQLVSCLKRASALDQESEDIESKRSELKTAVDKIDAYKSELDTKQARLNRYSQRAIDDFNSAVQAYNAMVVNERNSQSSFNTAVNAHNVSADAYNASCAKKYFADDLEQARKLAGM